VRFKEISMSLDSLCPACPEVERFVPVEKLPDALCGPCVVPETDTQYNILPKETTETIIVNRLYEVLYDLYNTYNC
jgi:hypothetical protein